MCMCYRNLRVDYVESVVQKKKRERESCLRNIPKGEGSGRLVYSD